MSRFDRPVRPAVAVAAILGACALFALWGYWERSRNISPRGREMASLNNLRYLGLAIQAYEREHRHYPARAIIDKDGQPLLSWRVALLPYLEEGVLYKQFHLDEPWDSEHNKKLVDKMPSIYLSPPYEPGKTTYLVPVAKGTIFGDLEQSVARSIIGDGPSSTILLVEADADQAVIWTKPNDLQIDPRKPGKGLGRLHDGVFFAAFADAHTSMMPVDISPGTLWALFTYAGGEIINNAELHGH